MLFTARPKTFIDLHEIFTVLNWSQYYTISYSHVLMSELMKKTPENRKLILEDF